MSIRSKAFTLIELLIVVAIIGILAAIAVPNFMNARIRAKVSHSISEMRTYGQIQQLYLMDQSDIPGHYDGKEEHCPYINLGYINGPLTDPFMEGRSDIEYFKNHEGMYHSTHLRGGDSEIKPYNYQLWQEWVTNKRGYILYGEGPVCCGAWEAYDGSNGIMSRGTITKASIRGKGPAGENLLGRKCN